MKKFIMPTFLVILSVLAILLFFRVLDSAVEVDNLKEQIKLQRKEMQFLSRVANAGFTSCHLSVADFESLATKNSREVLWNGDDGLAGALEIKKKDSCIVSIMLADWL